MATCPDRGVLVLNASFEAIHVCHVRRAIAMILKGVADYVESSPETIRSERTQLAVPEVIRLVDFVHIPFREVPYSKRNVLLRDGYRCQYCGAPLRKGGGMTVDHILPTSRGGRDTWMNVVACCRSCNHLKGNRTPEEAHMKLFRSPARPNIPAFLYRTGYATLFRAHWRKYIFQKDYQPVASATLS